MAKVDGPKYKLLKKTKVYVPLWFSNVRLYQIEAVRDIPRHGVKAGDKGGYVQGSNTLSQEGDCWISEGSIIIKAKDEIVSITDNALVEGNLVLEGVEIKGNSFISTKDSRMSYCTIFGDTQIHGDVYFWGNALSGNTIIKHLPDYEIESNTHHSINKKTLSLKLCNFTDAKVSGYGSISHVTNKDIFEAEGVLRLNFLSGGKYAARWNNDQGQVLQSPFKACGLIELIDFEVSNTPIDLHGEIKLEQVNVNAEKLTMNGGTVVKSNLKGIVDIAGDVAIYESMLNGENTILDDVVIKEGSNLKGKNRISGDTLVPESSNLYNVTLNGGFATSQVSGTEPKEPKLEETGLVSFKVEPYRMAIKSVEADYEAYTTDIVKLIKYPAMVDASVPETGELMVTLRSARRALQTGEPIMLEKAAKELELAFVRAENNAYTLASTFMDEKRKTTLKRAESALAIALDENATEHERRAGYKSGMKSLEGILPVSEEAVFILKERIGLKEIEA